MQTLFTFYKTSLMTEPFPLARVPATTLSKMTFGKVKLSMTILKYDTQQFRGI
jgi:hypothetical protein